MEAIQVLETIRTTFQNPSRFSKGSYAKNNKGVDVDWTDPTACRWCVYGLLRKLGNDWHVRDYLEQASDVCYPGLDLIDVNDTIGRKAVLNVVDMALDYARGEGI